MYLSAGSVLVNEEVGMLFIDFERGHRRRLDGTASIDLDDPLRGEYPVAQFVVRVRARTVFPNCPRYIHRNELVRRSQFVPSADDLTPVPEWKRSDWAADALPVHDPARDPGDRDVPGDDIAGPGRGIWSHCTRWSRYGVVNGLWLNLHDGLGR